MIIRLITTDNGDCDNVVDDNSPGNSPGRGLTRRGDWLSLSRSIAKTWLWMTHQFVLLPQLFKSILNEFSDVDDTIFPSSEFQRLIILSVKKCCLSSVLNRFFFSFSDWSRVLLLVSNSKKSCHDNRLSCFFSNRTLRKMRSLRQHGRQLATVPSYQ